MMRRWVLLVAAMVFLAGLFLDTAGVIELSWLCLRGQCGLPVRFVLPGLGLLIAGGALLIRPAAPVTGTGRRRAVTKAKATTQTTKPGTQKMAAATPSATKPGVAKAGVAKTGVVRPRRTTPSRVRRPASGQRPR